ncbi:hypothetical protein [Nocardia terrae]|uniref:hypothetical protein n=1 Tax=Nocardia terrae TaxID=2675851 RepID=UPI0018E02D99|nr:hypothetical protein [Nocardia terrae]
MSLRHGLLGLPAEGPASGYDLAQRFQEARAVEARRPKTHYVAGTDARLAVWLSRIPDRLRDRLFRRALGLSAIESVVPV